MNRSSHTELFNLFSSPDFCEQLLPYLSKRAYMALMAADKGLRQRVLTLTSSVQLRLSSDLHLFLSHSWPRLAILRLHHCRLETDHIQLLVCADLPQLKTLTLSQNDLSPLATKHLATSTWPLLTDLDITHTGLSTHTFANLMKADWPALRQLNLSNNSWPRRFQDFMPELAQVPWTSVQSLDLSGNPLSIKDTQTLGHLQWPQLTRLSVSGCFTPSNFCMNSDQLTQAMRFLAAGSWPHLKALMISNNKFTAASTAELVKGRWPELQNLDLGHCRHDVADPLQLKNAPWRALQHLDPGESHFIPEDANFLGHLQDTIFSLDLYSSFVTQARSGRTLALNFAAVNWPHLQSLDVGGNHLPAAMLLDITRGARLQTLKLSGNDISGWSQLALQNWDYLGMLDLRGSTINPEELCNMLHAGLETLFVACKVTEVVRSRPVDSSWPSETVLRMEVHASMEVLNSLSVGVWPVTSLTLTHDTDDELTDQKLSKAGLRALLEWELCALEDLSLNRLDLGCNDLPEVAQMLSGGLWPNLEALGLSYNRLNTKLVQHLVSGKWPNLVDLNLYDNRLQESGLYELLKAPHWPELLYLSVDANRVDSYGFQAWKCGTDLGFHESNLGTDIVTGLLAWSSFACTMA